MSAGLAAAAADGRHVLAIPAHGNAALAARLAGFARVEFVRGALCVRRLSALARDLFLLVAIHGRKAAVAPRALRRSGLVAAGAALQPAGDLPVVARDVSLAAPVTEVATVESRCRIAIVVA